MTPAARIAAAAEILDGILAGSAAEKALTGWARRSRFAGSGDRAAIRDHVFDAVRNRRSFAHLGGVETGRGLMIGLCRAGGLPLDELFTGQGHAPAPLTEAERSFEAGPMPEADAANLPDWLIAPMRESLGAEFDEITRILATRAPVFLRVNARAATREAAIAALAEEGIETRAATLSPTALEVLAGARRVARSAAFQSGLVELQDAASQAVCDLVPMAEGARVLDYCAGGGGKALALAARSEARVFAHDADPGRMSDLPARAERAGVTITQLAPGACAEAGRFETVLCDVPCSGSGAWRRAPEGKWRLTPDMLTSLRAAQSAILDETAPLVAPGGRLVYATCSVLEAENDAQIDAVLARHPDVSCELRKRFLPGPDGDGFYIAVLRKS
ncbi:RsmB/NOP family class I SAM-dependent RNA methyltransferase [Poseidonocella sedimentorum]|uniref:16S rRNA (Cytosine967-C5)-methyltransferase n=1 Tax=Poseidonocella sedimentorum TaxID=871652 RepID=A0A1I6EHW3_9RHOB|nr:RsmB/NOP family class I SAM-dependent RNA methyltransferase [Poseidonocella sedimentorum]SFR17295.1 16S rRNA (cytosine967-C5)-methyltransferase [Poseidonocella sedimentorum]